MIGALYTLTFWLTFMVSGLLLQCALFPLWVILGSGSRNSQRLAQHFRMCWSAVNLWIFFGVPSPRTLRSLSNSLPDQFILVSNHRCNLDPLFIFAVGRPLLFLSKKSVLKTPVIGWWMRMCGDVSVDRSDKESRTKSLNRMRERLTRGDSLLIFPEGTRQTEPQLTLGTFRDGAFQMATELEIPVVLLALHRTDEIWKKGELLLRPSRLRYLVSEPIYGGERKSEELKTEAFEKMTSMLNTLKSTNPV